MNLAWTYPDANAPSSATNPNKDTALVTSVTYSHDGVDRLTTTPTAPTAGGAVTRYEGFRHDGAGGRTTYLNATSTTCT
ncbi:hypothetical protein ACFFKU_04295 [Kineococcus gynurae]|uniref:YD repeat-containing protein n=1 Tax=Kineococcus gynurae TaxID=452979 RepID=A0ABV5LRG1_9ACTN